MFGEILKEIAIDQQTKPVAADPAPVYTRRRDALPLRLVEEREYPRALRPAYLVNDAGGTIRWEAWLKRTKADPGINIVAMVFEDGYAADADGVMFVGNGQTRATVYRGRAYNG